MSEANIGEITINRRFNGPPDSAHGGYLCGLIAPLLGGTAEVTLRRRPPLDTPLEVARSDGVLALREGNTLIAEAAPASVMEIEPPPPVTFAQAEAASRSYEGFRRHSFDTCFVCGPQRPAGDGLRIFPHWVAGRDVVAAPWVPAASLAGEDGAVRPEFVWAALDCPGAWAFLAEAGDGRPIVLGRFAAEVAAPVYPGERYVVTGWRLGVDGRKMYAGTALHTADGELRARARATWIRLA
ncbi:MAG: hypothetical protein WD379_09755 [Dehalococcoidia bacterium]